MPRSVMSAVTSGAGVMSNAGFSTGLCGSSWRTLPASPRSTRSSSPWRASIGIAAPLAQPSSTVDHGAATQNGSPLSRAASAFR